MNANDLNTEKWQPVVANEAYEISNFGRLRHTYKNGTTKGIVPSSNGGKNNYLFYVIDGNKYYVHQLVLHHFVGPKPEGYECDHKNSNKQDNRLCNLRYLTIFENRSKKGEAHGKSKLNNQKVLLAGELFSFGFQQNNIADLMDVTGPCIHSIIRRKTWNHI